MKGLESRRKEKENFVRKYYPTSSNSPGGTLNLVPNDVTSTGNRRVGKMNTCISENFSAVRLNFNKNIFDIDSRTVTHNQETESMQNSYELLGVTERENSNYKPTNHRRGWGPEDENKSE